MVHIFEDFNQRRMVVHQAEPTAVSPTFLETLRAARSMRSSNSGPKLGNNSLSPLKKNRDRSVHAYLVCTVYLIWYI